MFNELLNGLYSNPETGFVGKTKLLKASIELINSGIDDEKKHNKTMRKLQKEGLTKEDVLLSKVNLKLKELVKAGAINKGGIKNIKISDKPEKKLMAELKDGTIIHFGQKDSITFLEGGTEEKRQSYKARASKIKNKQGRFTFKIPFTSNFLAYNLLW